MDRTELVVGGIIVALVAAVVLIVALGGASCPKGQHLTVETYMPTYNAALKVTTMQPVYGCERGQ